MASRRNFIQKAIKKPGALHEELGVPKGQTIPRARIEAAAGAGGKLGQRARFALTLEHLPHPGPPAKVKKAKPKKARMVRDTDGDGY